MTLNSDVFNEGAPSFHRWCEIAALILVLHVGGGIAATVTWPHKVEPDPAGAVVMELSAMAVAPLRPEDLAIGPLVRESVPTLQPIDEAVPEESEFPELAEAPLAPDPEVALPKAEMLETVREAETVDTLREAQVGIELSAAPMVATAPPKLDAVPGEVITAQSLGANVRSNPAEIAWQKEILFHLNRYKRYPAAARARGVQGVTKVEFRLDAGGRLVDARIISGSGSEPLDEEALAVLRRASPFPEPPDRHPGEQVHLVLPIEFLIRR